MSDLYFHLCFSLWILAFCTSDIDVKEGCMVSCFCCCLLLTLTTVERFLVLVRKDYFFSLSEVLVSIDAKIVHFPV